MKYTSILILIIYCSNLYSQSTPNNNISDPYLESLKIYLKSLVQMNVYKPRDTVLISKKDYLSDFPASLDNLTIKMVDDVILWKMTNKRKTVRMLLIHPVDFKTGKSTIDIVNFGISRKRKHYTFINNGYHLIQYDFNCDSSQYIYKIIDRH